MTDQGDSGFPPDGEAQGRLGLIGLIGLIGLVLLANSLEYNYVDHQPYSSRSLREADNSQHPP